MDLVLVGVRVHLHGEGAQGAHAVEVLDDGSALVVVLRLRVQYHLDLLPVVEQHDLPAHGRPAIPRGADAEGEGQRPSLVFHPPGQGVREVEAVGGAGDVDDVDLRGGRLDDVIVPDDELPDPGRCACR